MRGPARHVIMVPSRCRLKDYMRMRCASKGPRGVVGDAAQDMGSPWARKVEV